MAQSVELNALDSNASAVMAVADTVRTTLGPKGLDKLLIDQAMNRHISNDGVTILLSLRAIHPVARMIVEIAERQEEMVGDGTTTAVVMAAEMIKEGKRLVTEQGIHPTKIIEGIESGTEYACHLLEKQAVKISLSDKMLENVVRTSLSSKLDGKSLTNLVLSALSLVEERAKFQDGEYDFNKSVRVIRKTNMDDKVINGIALERRRLDSELPVEVSSAKILIIKMSLKPVKESWVKENSQYKDILSMENDRLTKSKEIVDAIIGTGANTVLIASSEVDQAIEDLLVSKNVFAARISSDEVDFLSRFTGAKPVRMMEDFKNPQAILGDVNRIYEDEDHGIIFLEDGTKKNTVTILVSGSTKETSLERWRAAIDGINAAEAALNKGVVPGGGAVELHLIEKVRNSNFRVGGIAQVGLEVVMSALESIMRQILTNAGFNGIEKVMEARSQPPGYGIDITSGKPIDMMGAGVVDPLLVKTMALKAAAEIAKSVLRIDRNLAAENLDPQAVSESKR